MRALFVGRFQPPHRGHLRVILAAARRYDGLLVGVGSSQFSHRPDNPFTLGERFDMLHAALKPTGVTNVHLYPLPDIHHHAAWVRHVERLLPPFDRVLSKNPLTQCLFEKAGYRVEPVTLWRPEECSGTRIRARWRTGDEAAKSLPPPVLALVRAVGGIERVQALSRKVDDAEGRTRP